MAFVITGVGFTVTTIAKGDPLQNVTPGPVGIIVYVMSIGEADVLIGESLIAPLPPLPLLPVHVKVDPITLVVGIIFKVVPEHTTYVPAVTELPSGT
jgi:hypothetical protein